MSAHLDSYTNEDGIITYEVIYDPPAMPEVRVSEEVIVTLEKLGTILDEMQREKPTVRVYASPQVTCDRCGCDHADWDVQSYFRSYTVHLCDDCRERYEHEYKSFTRILH